MVSLPQPLAVAERRLGEGIGIWGWDLGEGGGIWGWGLSLGVEFGLGFWVWHFGLEFG